MVSTSSSPRVRPPALLQHREQAAQKTSAPLVVDLTL